MSLSPTTQSTASEVLAYDKGWAAINRLIRAGRSFSGRERNCCFLNLGGPRFATVSAALDVDLPDDSRGLALTDWDGDGRVDLWMTNRNGPRVRFLKNEYATEYHFLALRLVGTQSNRDAIGARVEVHLRDTPQPLIKTLAGGSGYISQSSKTLHFGLGPSTHIDRIVVHWPGAESETFSDASLQVDQRYSLVQGAGRTEILPLARRGPWTPHAAAEPTLPLTDRVVLLQPALVPHELSIQSLQGEIRPLAQPLPGSRGTLVNLWATWCSNCLRELDEWSHERQSLEQAGLHIINVCVDEPTDDRVADLQRIAEFSAQLHLPFEVTVGDVQVVEALNVFQRAFIGRQSDLPLPSSFLIDAEGRLAVIYKGPVSAAQVVEDAKLLGADRETIFAGAIPFSGQWLERPPVTSGRMAAVAFIEQGYTTIAEQYARQLLQTSGSRDPSVASDAANDPADATNVTAAVEPDDTVSLRHLLGAVLFDRQDFAGAREQYLLALELAPHNRDVRQELARTCL
ncbi:MAG: ASPIC/UnbV domain-containing protein, partial [Planctomycetales bacterium]|nr:ASPIC/UnbV domain-containing protein [Planctomycetales bacterium]